MPRASARPISTWVSRTMFGLLMGLEPSLQVLGDPHWCLEDKQWPSPGNRAPMTDDQRLDRYRRSIFKVEAGDERKFIANAALISPDGYFLTAAHVVQRARKLAKSFWISGISEDERTLSYQFSDDDIVYVGQPGHRPGNVGRDIAVFRVKDWNGLTNPIPLRYSEEFASGIFVAFPDALHPATKYTAEPAARDPDPDGPFRGDAFPGRSGSPILDQYGFAEGVIAAYNSYAEEEIQSRGGYEEYAEYLDKRRRFGASTIKSGDPWFEKLPLDETLKGIVDSCSKGLVPANYKAALGQDKYRDLPLYAIDRLYHSCLDARVDDTIESPKKTIEFKHYMQRYMETRCASTEDMSGIYRSLATPEKVEVARMAQEQVHNYSQFVTYLTDPRASPSYPQLLDAYLQLRAIAPSIEGINPTIHVDLATAIYELGIANRSSFAPESAIAKSVIDNLQQAKALGVDDAKINGLARKLAVVQKDWDTAAALTAWNAKVWDNVGALSSWQATLLGNKIDYYASEKAKTDPTAGWVLKWDQIEASHFSPEKKILGFTANAPNASMSYMNILRGH